MDSLEFHTIYMHKPPGGCVTPVGDRGRPREKLGRRVAALPGLLGRTKVIPAEIDTGLLAGSWRRLKLQRRGAVLQPHMNAAVTPLRTGGFDVWDDDVARRSTDPCVDQPPPID
ncbi:hypothetical protein [Nonomuraea fuscirosea]|uniref:hypothetical protein n=1 Tax=Nonomuraea fuscirosea TaxID=1291556 RepID=UPI0033EFFBA7